MMVLFSLSASQAWTKVEYDSNQLLMKNAEQLTELVRKKIKQAQDIQSSQEIDDDQGIKAEPGAIAALKDAVRITLSRPDQDGTRTNLFARLRRELTDLNAWHETLLDLAQEGIDGVRDTKIPLRHQATYVIMLENLMAELKPEVQSNETFRKIIAQVRDANLAISDKLKSQQLLRSMAKPVSPSATAAKLLPPTPEKSPKGK
jgi:hypothetical protein